MSTRRIAKVPLFGNIAKAVTVNLEATVGAQIGVDLLMPDGSLATTAKLAALFGAGTSTDSGLTTTDDLDEGQWNLWFTKHRVYLASKDQLQHSANLTITPDDGADTLTFDLADLADSGEGSLLAVTRDGKGRVSGSRAVTTDDLAPALDSAFFADILQTESGAALLTESGDLLTVD